jgi:glycosyltransferase involved in cell wall biosynthesis
VNILFLSRDYPPNLIGGVGIYVLEMSRLLARLGHRVYVLTQAVEYPGSYIDQGVTVFRIKPARLKWLSFIRKRLPGTVERLEYSWAVFRKLNKTTRRYSIDIIESSEARFEGFWYFLLRKKPKLVIKLHTPEAIALKLDNVRPDLDYKVRFLLERWWIKRADSLIGLTQAVKDLVAEHFGISLNGAPLVPNPIDIGFFKPLDSGIKHASPTTVLYVGRLEFRKGTHVLMRAIPHVLAAMPATKFVFVGKDSGMKQYLTRKAKESGYSDNISIIEGVPRYRLREFYQNCAICVLPSLWENHPYTCLEAMACAKPVIAAKTGGFPEIIQDRVNGILVEAGSSRGLAGAIISLLSDKDLSENLGRNARKTMEGHYRPEEVAQRTVSVYSQLLSNDAA